MNIDDALHVCYSCDISSLLNMQRRIQMRYRPEYLLQCPIPSARQHPSYGDCLEVKKEYYQNCSVLDCVTQCSQSEAHLLEQFLQVQQIGFFTLGPLRHVQRRLPRVVLLQHGAVTAVVLVGFKSDLDDQLVSFSALTLLVWSSGL